MRKKRPPPERITQKDQDQNRKWLAVVTRQNNPLSVGSEKGEKGGGKFRGKGSEKARRKGVTLKEKAGDTKRFLVGSA